MAHNSQISGMTMAHKDHVKGGEATSSTTRNVGSQTFHCLQESKISSSKDRRSCQDSQQLRGSGRLTWSVLCHTHLGVTTCSSPGKLSLTANEKIIEPSHLCAPLLSTHGRSSCGWCLKANLLCSLEFMYYLEALWIRAH